MTSRSSATERHVQTEAEAEMLMDSVERYGALKPKSNAWLVARVSFFVVQGVSDQ